LVEQEVADCAAFQNRDGRMMKPELDRGMRENDDRIDVYGEP